MGGGATTLQGGPVAVPTMGRVGALVFLGPGGITVTGAMSLVDGRSPLSAPLAILVLVVLWLAALASYLDGRAHAVTTDGTTVVISRRWSVTRFALADVTWVIDATIDMTGPLRVDGPERTVLGRRLPRLVPWPQLVPTGVHPSFWVRHLGVPEARVRGGGLMYRRRGLR